jgi:glycosyltransferase involved in cell wall biosynthesis
MKILLVGNYLPDRQHSMQRFAAMLRDGLHARGHEVRLARPRPLFAREIESSIPEAAAHNCVEDQPQHVGNSNAPAVAGALRLVEIHRPALPRLQRRRAENTATRLTLARKWFAYLDKYVVFPRVLPRVARWADVVHICDHSNAMYVAQLRRKPHVVTCHDLLAVRGALGENTDCPASFTGKILQRWILRSLQRAQVVVCVSSATRHDLVRLGGPQMEARSSVVMLGVAPSLNRDAGPAADALLADFPGIRAGRPFLLNVGSSLRRKNRDGALRIFKRVSEHLDCDLIFAGEPLSDELRRVKREIGLNGRVIEVPRPSDVMLEALYSRAFALLYPTKYEGFGWPAIEAQTCGCPVISSQSTSIPEVVGDSGFLRAPEDEEGFATDILRLRDGSLRKELIARGFENVKRFKPERMVNDYLEVYQKACTRSSN